MSAEAAVNRLMQLHPKGFDLSLDRIRHLLNLLGNPHLAIPPVFHVAGTNGKGSTTAFLRAILEAAGRRVHVHTSPHLVNWAERYRIGRQGGGMLVDDDELAATIDEVARVNDGRSITVFEIMSAVGFVLFARHKADYCILEVGLGGRFDATNVIVDPAACLITPVGLDHQAYLGDTIGKIAYEKAGIIKPGVPVFIGMQEDDARDVIIARAEALNAPYTIARQDFDFYKQAGRFVYEDLKGLLDLPQPALVGDHQIENAGLAIAASRDILPDLKPKVFEEAMDKVYWPGRFERLKPGKLTAGVSDMDIWIDGGHNPHAGLSLARELARLQARDPVPLVMIAGMLTTKEPEGFFRAFDGMLDKVITLPVADSDAGFPASDLAQIVGKCGFSATPLETIEEALANISSDYEGRPVRVLICGSLYLIGQILRQNDTPPQ